ncbi:hypothetical protein, partial [Pseudoalteromonas sp. Z1A6]|uniref:hypothetical protein n=1 Tax=Pseudoalteromonas sp. Z1A6 TaxID=2686349 RepID=UPI001980D4A9
NSSNICSANSSIFLSANFLKLLLITFPYPLNPLNITNITRTNFWFLQAQKVAASFALGVR